MEICETHNHNPFFSICIPQYNRTSFLIEACKVLAAQTFKDFEICISDDRSTDGREDDLISYLRSSGLSFVYKKQDKNLRYDGNIRASISLASGKYCLLHGNDDCLASVSTLEDLYEIIQKYTCPGVIITNFEDWQTGQKHLRIRRSDLFQPGAETAATHFRNVAFVSGVVVDRVKSQQFAKDKWDGSEMYQMYIVSKIIASGSYLLELDISAVRKDIQIVGENVDSYTSREKLYPCPIVERKLPIVSIGKIVIDAVIPYLEEDNYNKVLESIYFQLYLFTYPFWIIEYRRIQSWKYAVGLCLGFRPRNTFPETKVALVSFIKLYVTYYTICLIGLSTPVKLFDSLRTYLYSLSKTLFLQRKTSLNNLAKNDSI